jgi:antitoxin component YwqK of YwqJK toxin-antitoxin module
MIKVVLLVLASIFLANGFAQTLNVYENDSIYLPEPISYTETDSVDGVVTAMYSNNPKQIAFRANYYNKRRTGFVKYYYPNGAFMMTQVFQRGLKNGEYTLYDQQGKIVIKGFYEDNIKNGFWIYKKYQFMGDYKNGLKDGKWKYIDSNGKKIYYKYKKGVLKIDKIPVPLPDIPGYILRDGVIAP